MTKEIQPAQLLQRLKLPQEDLATLSFCRGNKPGAVESWISTLPAMQVEKTSILLYNALPEITRLKTSASNRLDMLEILRPYVQQCVQGLAKDFLNQPLTMEEKKLKTAVVAQALQKHMSNGYLQVARDMAQKFKPKKGADKRLELTSHRALTGLGLLLLRSYQLYTPVPAGLWIELHSVYQLAESLGYADTSVNDNLLQYSPACSLHHAYLRPLLLACSRPNQMRQTEVSATYEVLEDWVKFIKFSAADKPKAENLYLVNLSADVGPLYKSRFTGSREQEIREVDLSALITLLQRHHEQRESGNTQIKVPHTISSALVDHLLQAWSVTQQRAFERQPSKAHIDVCVGLSNLHQQITRGVPFDEFLGTEEEDEDDGPADPWITDFGTPSPASGADGVNKVSVPAYAVRVVDASPGGYCLEWSGQIPSQVKAGEVLGLREQGRHRWGLGVIRWIQQQRNATRMGIQLLAPKTTPYGAAQQNASGLYSDYARVLMLPELKAANQNATLLTANLPFKELDKVRLNHQGDVQEAQLTRRLFSTGSVSQFEFRVTAGSQARDDSGKTQREAKEQDFSSVWNDSD